VELALGANEGHRLLARARALPLPQARAGEIQSASDARVSSLGGRVAAVGADDRIQCAPSAPIVSCLVKTTGSGVATIAAPVRASLPSPEVMSGSQLAAAACAGRLSWSGRGGGGAAVGCADGDRWWQAPGRPCT